MKKILLTVVLCIFAIGANASSNITPTISYQDNIQDVLYLKNGDVVRGTILEQVANEYLNILVSDGSILTYKMFEIARTAREAVRQDNSHLENDITGYRGFIDVGYTVGFGSTNYKASLMDLTTSHGYQFDHRFFLGLGSGTHIYFEDIIGSDLLLIPIFVDFRYNILNGKFIPFVGLKAGYSIDTAHAINTSYSADGFYFSPTIGVKYMLTKRMAANITIGYSNQFVDYSFKTGLGKPIINRKGSLNGFSIKLGFEF